MGSKVVWGGEGGGWGVFFFKQKTAYEIYQCDWSSDVCSSDLHSSNERLDFYTYYSTAATALYIIAKYYINDTVITGLLFNDN